jgi:nitrogen fixation NifU-like protein
MMTTKVKGKACSEALDLTEQFRVLTTEAEDKDEPSGLGSLAVFSGIRDLPSRVKCALLPWHTLIAAINSQSEISTEGDKDPVPGSGTDKVNN